MNAEMPNSPELNDLPGDPNIDHHLEQFVLLCSSIAQQSITPRLFIAAGTCVWQTVG
jgi:hypothetical protein